MEFFSIASGSSGNCVCIGTESGRFLVDAGISTKRIAAGLQTQWIQGEDIRGLFVTHEHSDHIKGLPVLVKKYRIPVYGTAETLRKIRATAQGAELPGELLHPIQAGETLRFDRLKVKAFSVPHDAANPVAYTFCENGTKIALATDLGYVDECILRQLRDANLLYIESNYDRNMLLVGIYPYPLKQRILGEYGHLSNDDSAAVVRSVLHENLKAVVLAHLSKENNYPELAYQTMENELRASWHYAGEPPRLLVARRDEPTEMITVSCGEPCVGSL